MKNYYNISKEYNGLNLGYAEPIRIFKGETEIVFNFEEISIGTFPIIKMIIDFNDNTPLLIKDFSYETNEDFKKSVVHRYHPDSLSYFIVYYPTIYLTFSNFSTFVYQACVKIAKSSFYSEYERLTIASCQFMDVSANSMFVTLDTINGDILNLKIK